jgi:hypothetical protein
MLWRCTECTCAYAAGLPACPHCAGTEHEEDGEMPKIHKDRAPTFEADIIADVVVPKELREDYREPLEETPRPSPRKRNTRVQAGVAAGSGKAPL